MHKSKKEKICIFKKNFIRFTISWFKKVFIIYDTYVYNKCSERSMEVYLSALL